MPEKERGASCMRVGELSLAHLQTPLGFQGVQGTLTPCPVGVRQPGSFMGPVCYEDIQERGEGALSGELFQHIDSSIKEVRGVPSDAATIRCLASPLSVAQVKCGASLWKNSRVPLLFPGEGAVEKAVLG